MAPELLGGALQVIMRQLPSRHDMLPAESDRERWKREWLVLKLEGLLVFEGVADRVPKAHIPIDGGSEVLLGHEDTSFTLCTGFGRSHTFACEEQQQGAPSPEDPHVALAADEWVRKLRLVIEVKRQMEEQQMALLGS